MLEPYDPNLDSFDDVFDQFKSKEYRKQVSGVSANWLSEVRDWKHFITLTFKNDVSDEHGMHELKRLIRHLNENVFGTHYTRKVGHSYFSYVCGIEQQERGTVHFHIVADRPINQHELWNWWYHRNGYVKHQSLDTKDDAFRSIAYSLKYSTKDGEAIIYLAKEFYAPVTLPPWWLEDRLKEVLK